MEMRINWFRGYTEGEIFLPPVFVKSYDESNIILLSLLWDGQNFNQEDFFNELIDKIQLEFFDEKTKVSKSSSVESSEDLNLFYESVNSHVFLEPNQNKKLVEFIIFKKLNEKVLVYSLGHFNVFHLKKDKTYSLLSLNDFSVDKYLLPSRGLGISDKSSVVTLELPLNEKEEFLIVRGLFVPSSLSFSQNDIDNLFLNNNKIPSSWVFHLIF